MSTVVNNGYRLRAGTDIFDFQQQFRAVLAPARLHEDMAMLVNIAGKTLWDALLQGEPVISGDNFLEQALSAYEKRQSVRRTRSFMDDPNRCNVQIGRQVRGQHMVRLLCENPRLLELFESLEAVEEYAYDGRTDGYPDFTDEQWRQRLDDWEGLHAGDVATNEVMLDLTLFAEPVYDELGWAVWMAGTEKYAGLWELAIAKANPWSIEGRLVEAVMELAAARGVDVSARPMTSMNKVQRLIREAGTVDEVKSTLPALTLGMLTASRIESLDIEEIFSVAAKPIADQLVAWAQTEDS